MTIDQIVAILKILQILKILIQTGPNELKWKFLES